MKCHICGANTTHVCDICSKPACEKHMHDGRLMVGAIIPGLGILVLDGGARSEHCEDCCPDKDDKKQKRKRR